VNTFTRIEKRTKILFGSIQLQRVKSDHLREKNKNNPMCEEKKKAKKTKKKYIILLKSQNYP